LCRLKYDEKKREIAIPTGVTFVTLRKELRDGDRTSSVVHYPIESVACPDCKKTTLRGGFKKNDPCPKCGIGELVTDFIEY
jgi:hypothetical protein